MHNRSGRDAKQPGEDAIETKLLEVRDACTFLPVIAIKVDSTNVAQRYLLGRCGYERQMRYVLLSRLSADGLPLCYSPDRWNDRTMTVAHGYILENFDRLADGDVVDVEYILGERKEPKLSERYA